MPLTQKSGRESLFRFARGSTKDDDYERRTPSTFRHPRLDVSISTSTANLHDPCFASQAATVDAEGDRCEGGRFVMNTVWNRSTLYSL